MKQYLIDTTDRNGRAIMLLVNRDDSRIHEIVAPHKFRK